MSGRDLDKLLGRGRPAVAVAVTDQTTESQLAAIADSAVDVVEFRVDQFGDHNPSKVLEQLERLKIRPAIGTVRSQEEGGAPISDDHRITLYRSLMNHVDAIDIELASENLHCLGPEAQDQNKVVIVSTHDFNDTPPLEVLLAKSRAARTAGANLFKVATTTERKEDLQILAQLVIAHAHAASSDKDAMGIIAVGMGSYGPASRVLLPALGSVLTFASGAGQQVEGQLNYADTTELLARLIP